MIEERFDISFIADLAHREKQIQQNYRPIIAVHKWFARRPGTLFRGLLLAEFSSAHLKEAFYQSHNFAGLHIADPFMGGGTPLLEANRLGCDISGWDINPMAYWIVRQEIEHVDLVAYRLAAEELRASLEAKIGPLYRTHCLQCGCSEAHAKSFLWVKQQPCEECGTNIVLFPGYLLAENRRHPVNVFICRSCGDLCEVDERKNPGNCQHCGASLISDEPAGRGQCVCPSCRHANHYPNTINGPLDHKLVAIEYYCHACKANHIGRFFKSPDETDITAYRTAQTEWQALASSFVPDDPIPSGDESDRLHRWGYKYYYELFNSRQLLGLELSCRFIASQEDVRIRNALATNLSDLLRYQNMLCRYDTMALKSLDIFSVHGFPVGLVQCESNLLGIPSVAEGTSIGSGGWTNIIEKYIKAKTYCEAPFEVRHTGTKKVKVPIAGEWIGDMHPTSCGIQQRQVILDCQDASKVVLSAESLDAVFTDPPYYGNVQYAELMDFCYVWLRQLLKDRESSFAHISTRHPSELTANANMGRGLDHFTEGLSNIYQRMSQALKPGAPFAFTYHHNLIEAYLPVAVAVLDADMICTASLPCPAEMGASIHINGTGSSTIDTVFVCRSIGAKRFPVYEATPESIAGLIHDDVEELKRGHVTPTPGDIRCITYGHLVRLAINHLSTKWDRTLAIPTRLEYIRAWLVVHNDMSAIEHCYHILCPQASSEHEPSLPKSHVTVGES